MLHYQSPKTIKNIINSLKVFLNILCIIAHMVLQIFHGSFFIYFIGLMRLLQVLESAKRRIHCEQKVILNVIK